MARHIVGEFLLKPEDLDTVWPAPKMSSDGGSQVCGPDGIQDPMMKRELWGVAGDIFRADLQKTKRSPEDIAKVRAILGQAGYELAAEEVAFSAA